jgi:uncharacterized protein Veg
LFGDEQLSKPVTNKMKFGKKKKQKKTGTLHIAYMFAATKKGA